jgi:hypothetical protein
LADRGGATVRAIGKIVKTVASGKLIIALGMVKTSKGKVQAVVLTVDVRLEKFAAIEKLGIPDIDTFFQTTAVFEAKLGASGVGGVIQIALLRQLFNVHRFVDTLAIFRGGRIAGYKRKARKKADRNQKQKKTIVKKIPVH